MRIGELAEKTGLSAKTIRFYESARLLPDPGRTASGYRAYRNRDSERLVFIRKAKRMGLSLAE
ncbi:MAG: MerR family transcriptional regulator, partial [Dehalococcoidia bacterium]